MARPRVYEEYFENTPTAKKQLGILRALFDEKTEEQILAEAISLLYTKEKPNIDKMIEDVKEPD